MFAGIIELSIPNGYDEIVTATDLRSERILNRADRPMKRSGERREIGRTIAITGSLPANPDRFNRVRPVGYKSSNTQNSVAHIRSAV